MAVRCQHCGAMSMHIDLHPCTKAFQAGADAARRECAEIAGNVGTAAHKKRLNAAIKPSEHRCLRAVQDSADDIATAILTRVGQPVKED